MSSFSGRYLCRVCKDPEVLPLRPLVRCDSCRGGWHPACNPAIGDQKRAPFCCSKCLRKKAPAQEESSAPATSTGWEGEARDRPELSSATAPGKPVVAVKLTAQSTALPPKNTLLAATNGDAPSSKRKRGTRSTRTSSDLKNLRAIQPRLLPDPQLVAWPDSSQSFTNGQPPQRRATYNGRYLPNTARDERITQLPGLVPSGVGYETSSPFGHYIPDAAPLSGNSYWRTVSDAQSQPDAFMSGTTGLSATSSAGPETNASSGQNDIDMTDSPRQSLLATPNGLLDTIEKNQEQPKDGTQTAASESPMPPLVSRSTTPGDNSAKGSPSFDETAHLPWSLEAQRRHKAESYDPSGLDAFLDRQRSRAGDDDERSHEELLKTQVWGHVDPHAAWPKVHSPEWRAEKVKEIEARGGRKANFGKLLTAQVRKEREERGWGIHQNKDVVDDEKSAAAKKALEELFNIRDIDSLEPAIRNGQLAMVEKGVDAEGKPKDNAVYFVG